MYQKKVIKEIEAFLDMTENVRLYDFLLTKLNIGSENEVQKENFRYLFVIFSKDDIIRKRLTEYIKSYEEEIEDIQKEESNLKGD